MMSNPPRPPLQALCAVLGLSLFAGCASTQTQMSAHRGTGAHKTISASPDEIIEWFTIEFEKVKYLVTQENDAVYATDNPSIGINYALFLSSGTSPGTTNAEALVESWMIGHDSSRGIEMSLLNMIAKDVAKARLGRKLPESLAATTPSNKASKEGNSTERKAPALEFQSDIETPSFQLPEDETKFALVVGVENYQAAPKAEYAARDARAVKAYLKASGYPERNIVLLTDQQAGKSGLEKYLEAWLPRNTGADSTVLFYFSGHGSPDIQKGEAYLMPWDADPKYVETTGYPMRRLYAKLNELKARRVLVAMDACFSGAGGRSVMAKGARPLVTKVDDGGSSAGRVGVLTASASDEITGTDDASGHGLFTYQLLKSINARGGKATFKQLFDSLSPKVRDAARRDNRDQTPQLIGDGLATF